MVPKICSVEECPKKSRARGWCEKHYYRWRKNGDPLAVKELHASSPEGSLALRTEWQGDCLVWTGWRDDLGYGRMKVSGRKVRVHRYTWERVNGPIPEGMYIDHICRNPSCCNPDHLRLATAKQNAEHAGLNSDNVSGYRGVSWRKREQKWSARVKHAGKEYSAGYFDTAEEAGEAAKALRLKLYTHNDLDRVA